MRYVRVSKKNPCPICNHADWCGVSEDGAVCICMRTESPRQAKNGGWVHQLKDTPLPPPQRRQTPINSTANKIRFPKFDVKKQMEQYRCAFTSELRQTQAKELGLPEWVLSEYGCGYSQVNQALAIPMYNNKGVIVGIRLRNSSGKKWAVACSLQGFFKPNREVEDVIYICEGPTDTMACAALGFYAIGRPSCSGMVDEVASFIKQNRIRMCYIIADADGIKKSGQRPGIVGAKKMAEKIKCLCRIAILPAKDMREFYRSGGTAELLGSIVNQGVLINGDKG